MLNLLGASAFHGCVLAEVGDMQTCSEACSFCIAALNRARGPQPNVNLSLEMSGWF